MTVEMQRYEAKRIADAVRARRREFQRHLREIAVSDGRKAARFTAAEAIVSCEPWIARADALDALSWIPGIGEVAAEDVYALTGARSRRTVGELSPRQRGVLAEGLRALGAAR